MPVSKYDKKRKRREDDIVVDCFSESPKRTKVHAQRKFAQGAVLLNTNITPIKEPEKEKPKPPETAVELLPLKRPNTEDFLTFLCFRGTSILPSHLDFFNTALPTESIDETSKDETSEKSELVKDKPLSSHLPDRPFVAFGVRKHADPFVNSKLERKRRHALTVQSLRKRYQDKRLAKIRAIAESKVGATASFTNKNFIKTRSSLRNTTTTSTNANKIPLNSNKRKYIVLRKMCLRSRSRIVRTEVITPVKRGVKNVTLKNEDVSKKKKKLEISSDFSSDDEKPLLKTVTKVKPINKSSPLKIARKTASIVPKSNVFRKTPLVKNKVNKRFTRSNPEPETAISQRPTRKTKEAATLYMELLGQKLVLDQEVDDDTLSIDSFPELPNVKRAEQRENEIRAQSKNRMITRNNPEKDKINKSNCSKLKNMNKKLNQSKISQTKNKITSKVIEKNPTDTLKNKCSTRNTKKNVIENTKNIARKKPLEVQNNTQIVKKHSLEVLKKKSIIQTSKNNSTKLVNKQLLETSKRKRQEMLKKRNEKPQVKKDIKKSESVSDNNIKDLRSRNVKFEEKIKIQKEITPVKVNDTKQNNEIIDVKSTKNITDSKNVSKSTKVLKNENELTVHQEKNEHKIIPVDTSAKIKKSTKSTSVENSTEESKEIKNTESNLDQSFSDSDEEPLATKLKPEKDTEEAKNIVQCDKNKKPTNKIKSLKNIDIKSKSSVNVSSENINVSSEEKQNKIERNRSVNTTSADPNFLLSDDDEEKYFHGFVKTETCANVNDTSFQFKEESLSDSMCKDIKDIERRYGKGKVNMSAEQIEKWLNDADKEMKKESLEKLIQKEELLKTQQKIQDAIAILDKSVTENVTETNELLKSEKSIDSSKHANISDRKTVFQQRRPIINKSKEKNVKTPNKNAFSPDNESSVYAFEAETDAPPVNTPFRHHCRRSSSTVTSKSEDESAKTEEELKKSPSKFRFPTLLKQDVIKSDNKQVQLTLSADDNNCASIAVQVNLDGSTSKQVAMNSNIDYPNQTDAADDGELFYIPLQNGPEGSSNQQIGVSVKLDTTGANVIMQAKLVTKPTGNQNIFPMSRMLLPQSKPSTSMYPPIGTVQPFRTKPSETVKPLPKPATKTTADHAQFCDDTKTDKSKPVPTSPSTSSSSSARLNKRLVKVKPRQPDSPMLTATVSAFPKQTDPAQIVNAPSFYPTEKEFQDPLEYIDKIRPLAESFGLCRIVPPTSFKPECKISDDMRFTAYNQYVHKMLNRWGPNVRELTAIRKYLATQNIALSQAPWIGCMEVDLPRLYQTVQLLGGLKEVIEKKRWPRVAELMRIPKSAQDRLTKLDDIYCKYLLPYDTLSPGEREKLLKEADTDWEKHCNNMSSQASSDEANDSDDLDANECIVRGRSIALNSFYRIARNTMAMWFKSLEPSATDVEQEFWKHVNDRTHHLCVNSGSIDSSSYGYGFACSKNSPFARHPWNLKVLTNNSGSILRSMGPIMGVTVPTIHVGMLFSACCWYRDPHCLPWIEYLHTGGSKVWYGIPDSMHSAFRQTLNKIIPNLCRKTSVWLPSDTAMIPPSLLVENNVSLCRIVQEPGQFIVIFPKAFTSSLCTGYTVSESVFFAQSSWLDEGEKIFTELKESCEPSMFSLEKLFLSIAVDSRCSLDVCRKIFAGVENIIVRECAGREKLKNLGLIELERLPQSNKKKKKADTEGEYLCEVCRSNLYVSLVSESQDDGVYCLQHAAEYLESKKIEMTNCKLMYSYSEEELNDIVNKLKNHIDTKSQKKNSK